MTVRVFLVEDMQHLRGVVADLLRSLGDFTLAGSASTEAEALLWVDENPGGWDLAVLDLVLDQGTGMGVIARCHKQRLPGGRVVVFSDYVTPGILKHCLKLGADAAIPKSEPKTFIAYCSAMVSGDGRAGWPPD